MQYSFYPESITKYLQSPPNTGALEADGKTVFSVELGDLAKYIKIRLYLEIDDAIIKQVKYLVYGDGYIIAALSKLSEDLPGLKVTQALNYSMTNLAAHLSIPPAKSDKLKIIKNGLNAVFKQYLDSKI